VAGSMIDSCSMFFTVLGWQQLGVKAVLGNQ
jgi:hypothetical protein